MTTLNKAHRKYENETHKLSKEAKEFLKDSLTSNFVLEAVLTDPEYAKEELLKTLLEDYNQFFLRSIEIGTQFGEAKVNDL